MDKTRRDGGYVLVYVVVVIVILCILVPAACSNSLQNLKAQQASVERMRQLYTAEGQIERFYAEIEAAALPEDKDYPKEETAFNGAKGEFQEILDNADAGLLIKKNETWTKEDGKTIWHCVISAVSKEADVIVAADIRTDISVKIEPYWIDDEPNQEKLWSYKITSCTITYESYDISATAGNESEEVTP